MVDSRRLSIIVLSGLLVLPVALGGCAKKQTPTANPTVSTTLGEATQTPTAAPSTSASPAHGDSAPTYPTSAKSYAQALLNAWGNKDNSRIDQLAVQSAVQQIKDSGYPNSSWTYIKCSAVDTTYTECLFRNAYGDECTVKMVNSQLGHPTAVLEAPLMRTEYPNNAGDYISNFVYAWQQGNIQRMTRLSNSTVANFLKSKPAPTSYTTSPIDAGTMHSYMTIYPTTGGSFTFTLLNASFSKSHAIEKVCDICG
jgi:hypothetical protein